MNKYQEALNRLSHNAYQSVDNKWKYGLGIIDKSEIIQHKKDVSTLEELVDRATPKKPFGKHTSYKCPVCDRRVRSGKGSSSFGVDHYCQRCGQTLDWSKDE